MILSRMVALLAFSILTLRSETWTLQQALLLARTNSPDSRIAQHRIAAAHAVLAQANAAFWPRLQAASSYTQTDHPASVFSFALNQQSYSPSLDFNSVPAADNLNVRGALSIPLYAGGRNVAARDAAKAGAKAAQAEAEAIAQALEFEVARAFYTIQKSKLFIEAASSAVRAYETNRGLAENRLRAGAALKTELLDIDVRLGEAREELVRARNAHALAKTALRNLLGLEDQALEVADEFSDIQEPAADAGSQRPEFLALSSYGAAAEASVRKAKGGYLPEVDAFAHLDHDSGWEFNGSGHSYAVGVVARWNLWDGQLTRNRVREAESRLDQIREEKRKLRLQVQFEIEQAHLQLAEAIERVSVTRQTVLQAEESVTLTRARFEQGLALASQLIDAETALTGAKVRKADAEAGTRIARAALRKALGLSQLEGLHP